MGEITPKTPRMIECGSAMNFERCRKRIGAKNSRLYKALGLGWVLGRARDEGGCQDAAMGLTEWMVETREEDLKGAVRVQRCLDLFPRVQPMSGPQRERHVCITSDFPPIFLGGTAVGIVVA